MALVFLSDDFPEKEKNKTKNLEVVCGLLLLLLFVFFVLFLLNTIVNGYLVKL